LAVILSPAVAAYPIIPVYLVVVVVEAMNRIVRVKRFVEAILMEAQGAEEEQEVSLQAAEQQLRVTRLLLTWIPLVPQMKEINSQAS
jgi:hypothetical protein